MISKNGFIPGICMQKLELDCANKARKYLQMSLSLTHTRNFEHHLIKSLQFPDKTTESKPTGKKITDYLANPVPTRKPTYTKTKQSPNFKGEKVYGGKNAFNHFYISRYHSSVPSNSVQKTKTDEESALGSNVHNTFSGTAKKDPLNRGIDRSIKTAAAKYNISPDLIRAVIRAESGFKQNAVSPTGAKGLMQLMPQTARELGVKDPFNIDQNIDGGTRYLKKMLDLFGGNVKKALAAYNAGPGTVKRYNGIPPYRETTLYVERVLKYSKMVA